MDEFEKSEGNDKEDFASHTQHLFNKVGFECLPALGMSPLILSHR